VNDVLARRAVWRRMLVVLLPVLVLCGFVSVRATARHERVLIEDQAAARRLVTHLLTPDNELDVPVEPGTDVLRIVVHAYRRGMLGLGPHRVLGELGPAGALGPNDGHFDVSAPGPTSRVVPEDHELSVGDPVAFNVYVREATVRSLTLKLISVSDADGVLVRLYRRQAVDGVDAVQSPARLGEVKRERLARRAGELDFADLEMSDRSTLVDARWRRVAPIQGEGRRTTPLVIALAPREPRTEPQAVAAAELDGVSPSSVVAYHRATLSRPVIVRAGESPLVIKVHARRPVSPSDPSPATVDLIAEMDGERAGISRAEARVSRSSVDWYDASGIDVVPTERATFYVVVPANARAALHPSEAELDLSLFELDPRAPPEPLRASGPAAPSIDSTAATRSSPAFIFRLPTNAHEFVPGAHGTLHVAPGVAVPRTSESSHLAVAHVQRPVAAPTLRRDGRLFVTADRTFSLRARGEPLAVPLRFYSTSGPSEVLITVDGDRPKRRAGIATTLTRPRRIRVDGDARATFVVGDDLTPGEHTVTVRASDGVWVHLPWTRGAPRMTTWVSGDFDP